MSARGLAEWWVPLPPGAEQRDCQAAAEQRRSGHGDEGTSRKLHASRWRNRRSQGEPRRSALRVLVRREDVWRQPGVTACAGANGLGLF